MKLSRFFDLAIKSAVKHDPRNRKEVSSYEDSAILYGKPDINVKKILVGIDIEVGEILLADCIRQRQGLDLVLSHHPEGFAYASLHKVMNIQTRILRKAGINKTTAEELLQERQREVERRLLPNNHTRAVDAAKLLGMPFACLHTPADNHVFSFLAGLMDSIKPGKVSDIIDILMEIPEYKAAQILGAGPRIIAGSPNRPAGKILVEMTGGTEGSAEMYSRLYKTGTKTLICMHLSEDHFKKVKDANLNVVIAGHISSDTLGLNLLLDNVEKQAKEKLTVLNCSGFQRYTRS